MKILFLQMEEVLEIHQDQIHRYGGSAGARDMELLQSALAMPSAGFVGQYLHADIFEMAAAYLFHFIQGHPFTDGNKRTGAMAAFVFLRMNGITLTADEKSFEKLVLNVTKGKADKQVIAEFLRKNSKPTVRR